MNRRWRNLFFIFGLLAVAVMLVTLKSDWARVREALGQVGLWFPAIVLLWGVVYLMNTCSFGLILKDGKDGSLTFPKIFQLTVSGYALNYVTPLGLLGGEPYRIMELSGLIGKKRAAAGTLLYAMMHVCSHFCLWMTAIPVYVILHFACDATKYPLGPGLTVLLAVTGTVLALVLYLFSLGYRKGFVVRVSGLLCRVPFLGRRASDFMEKNGEKLAQVDELIQELHASRCASFWGSLLLEYLARVLSSVEYWLLIGLLVQGFTFWDGLLVLAFSSLFSNLVFFSPMQLGGHEGGVAIAAAGLQMPGAYGVYVALVTRLRELVWTVLGILLVKICHGKRTAH